MTRGAYLTRLLGPRHPLVTHAKAVKRRVLKADERLRNEYLKTARVPKLQIGGGWARLDGWLNVDIEPLPGTMVMDAAQPFPFDDGIFQFVFTEHMIEHIAREAGLSMLRECHRIMRPGGMIRVVTPDLAAILGLYQAPLSPEQQSYVTWFCKTFLPGTEHPNPALVINAMFRNWGHQFLYDERSLTDALNFAGFTEIKRVRLGESRHADLRNLENIERYPEGFLEFESVALEALR